MISLFHYLFKLLGPSWVGGGEVEDVITSASAKMRQFGSEEIGQLYPNKESFSLHRVKGNGSVSLKIF